MARGARHQHMSGGRGRRVGQIFPHRSPGPGTCLRCQLGQHDRPNPPGTTSDEHQSHGRGLEILLGYFLGFFWLYDSSDLVLATGVQVLYSSAHSSACLTCSVHARRATTTLRGVRKGVPRAGTPLTRHKFIGYGCSTIVLIGFTCPVDNRRDSHVTGS